VGYTEEELHALYFLDVTHEDYSEANWAFITEEETELRRMTDAVASYIYVLRPDGTALYPRAARRTEHPCRAQLWGSRNYRSGH
jgi:hypothetical protein